ncbi:MAG TPA: DUF2911 domain-containing protein [Aequorivita sp.]|nr:DUF2911 domain-containing protein [Aequorivita sp.]
MKRIFLLFAVLLFSYGVHSQIQTPQPSPAQKVDQKVGLTDVTLDYSRPSMRGRAIYGNLVPFDKLWRTGANSNSVISFSHDVEIGGKSVKAGSYSIFSKPGVSSWEVYFYNDTNNWGLPEKWDDKKVVAQVKVPTVPMTIDTETFTLSIDNISNDSATLGIQWAKTYVGVPIKFPTDEIVSSNIDRAMNGPSSSDYYAAAVYYFEANKDIHQAKKWMDKAMELNKKPMFYQLRQKALIYAKAGDKKGAIEAAKESLEGAKKAGNSDYVALNTKSLKEWGAM